MLNAASDLDHARSLPFFHLVELPFAPIDPFVHSELRNVTLIEIQRLPKPRSRFFIAAAEIRCEAKAVQTECFQHGILIRHGDRIHFLHDLVIRSMVEAIPWRGDSAAADYWD